MSTPVETETTSQSDVSAESAPSSEQGTEQTQPPEGGEATTEESKPAALGVTPDEKPTGESADAPADSSDQQAPETYEFTSPDGQENIGEKVHGPFSDAARKLNLSNDGAQTLLDAVYPGIQAAAQSTLDQARAEWHEKAKTDKLIGGEAFKTNLRIANGAFEAFGDEELRSVLKTSGLGNHPAILRMFYRAGTKISEDSLVPGGRPSPAAEDLRDERVQASRLYPEEAKAK